MFGESSWQGGCRRKGMIGWNHGSISTRMEIVSVLEETSVYYWPGDDLPDMRGDIITCAKGSVPLGAETIDRGVLIDAESEDGIIGLDLATELQMLERGEDSVYAYFLASSVLYT